MLKEGNFFYDKINFWLKVSVNKQNCRIWSEEVAKATWEIQCLVWPLANLFRRSCLRAAKAPWEKQCLVWPLGCTFSKMVMAATLQSVEQGTVQ